jgi:SAM-dependent methyltransferase
MARILDLGCGTGKLPLALHVSGDDEIVGIDIDEKKIAMARHLYPERRFECARGESLPFPDASFDCIVSSVAVPYMDIPRTLSEVRRVLVPGGKIRFSIHPPGFTLKELRHCRALLPTLYRLFVLFNGMLFHLSGRTLRVASRCESFQTERGMQIALRRAGFIDPVFSRPKGRLLLEARGPVAARAAAPVFVPATAS